MTARASGTGTRQPQVSEKQEQAAIVELLEAIGAKVYVLGTRRPKGDFQGTRQTPGIPDLYALLPTSTDCDAPRALWIEVKAASGRMSQAQIDFALACGGRGIAHTTGGQDAVAAWLKYWSFLK
jgi:hypothetical protein